MQNFQSSELTPSAETACHDRVVRVGTRVRMRRQRWSVVDVRAYDTARVLTVRGIGPLNFGDVQRVVTPFEAVEPLDKQPRLRIVGRRRWRRECRTLLARTAPAGSLSVALHARIDLMPFQLEPALAIVRGLGTRVLLADEVGLGKTIQAGLIVLELRALSAADRILVLTPAGLRDQWAVELEERFKLEPVVVDVHQARRQAALLPVGMNPWATLPVAIASIDYAKRPEVLPAVIASGWDVVIVDEAHGVTPGSDRHRAVNALCAAAPYVVLLTATPHSGDRAAFTSLCRIGAGNNHGDDKLLVFRRRRQDVVLGAGRRVHCLRVRSTADDVGMHDRLAELTRAIDAENGDKRTRLALATLHKRAMSSAHSLFLSVVHRESRLADTVTDEPWQLTLPLDEGEHDRLDDRPAWDAPGLRDVTRERRMLAALREAAYEASARETKLIRLKRLLARLSALGEPVIVFTEYRDTLHHVERVLFASDGVRPAILHGGLTREERGRALDDFRSGRRAILLATDAGGEGLNLQATCRVVINLELPWNPMRLEQRVGRVDRIGQRRRVHAFNLIGSDTGETRVLERLRSRVALARQDIDAADPLTSTDTDEDELLRSIVSTHSTRANESEDLRASNGCPDNPPPATPLMAGGYGVFVELTSESRAEHSRLLFARQLLTGASDRASCPVDSLLAFARHPVTRYRLSPHVLVLLESICEDRASRTLASRITPLRVRIASRVSRNNARELVADILHTLDFVQLQTTSELRLASHEDFWSARLARERVIAASESSLYDETFQPGLFDHRAERAADGRMARHRAAAERLALLKASAEVGRTATRAVAILIA